MSSRLCGVIWVKSQILMSTPMSFSLLQSPPSLGGGEALLVQRTKCPVADETDEDFQVRFCSGLSAEPGFKELDT